jgi:hypothetical protein
MLNTVRWVWLGLGLAWVSAGMAGSAEKAGAPPAAAAREPEIRHLKPRKDAADLKRIKFYRAKLPLALRWRNNFAWARAEIEGLAQKEYFAHSRIQDLDDFSARQAKRLQGISLKTEKEKARFQTLFVDFRGNIGGPDALPRHFDTEYKILEDIAARLPDSAAAGTIRLYTNLEPCPSCRGVMRQFLVAYSNVTMEVLYEWPP